MKKHQERALNAFAALESLPDGMLLEAEQALIAAEGGVITTVKKPKGGFARIMSSGWTAAAISCIVALGVLIFIVRAGREAPAYQPPVKPAGSTIEMATEGADFTISTEVENYPDGVGSITVVMTGRVKGKTITAMGGWHLERLTPEGAVAETVYYTEEVTISAKPGRDEYATISKTLYGSYTGGGFPAGTYRLHATKFDGEKYVSVAYCTFTVGNPDADFEMAFPGFRVSLPEIAYLYDKPNGLVISRDTEDPGPPELITDESLPATRTLTVDGQELTLTYRYTQSLNSPSDTDHYTISTPSPATPRGSGAFSLSTPMARISSPGSIIAIGTASCWTVSPPPKPRRRRWPMPV